MDVMPLFNAVDIGAVVLLILGVLLGFSRRLSGELTCLISVVAAFVVGLFLCRPLTDWFLALERLGPQPARVLAFLAALVVAGVLMILARLGLARAIRVVFSEQADRLLGALAGLVRSLVLIAVIFIVANLVPSEFLNRQFGEASAIGRVVRKFMPAIEEKLPAIEERAQQIVESYGAEEDADTPSRRKQ
ncbi:MAG: CvpA family protein [Verrucomicrobiota bacterium]|nr:CvpA family protein [Verrucomicrobiota bacterium]